MPKRKLIVCSNLLMVFLFAFIPQVFGAKKQAVVLSSKNKKMKSSPSSTRTLSRWEAHEKGLSYEQKVKMYQIRRKGLQTEAGLGWAVFLATYSLCFFTGVKSILDGPGDFGLLMIPVVGPVVLGVRFIVGYQLHWFMLANIAFSAVLLSGIQVGGLFVGIGAQRKLYQLKKPKPKLKVHLLPWMDATGVGLALRGSFY